VPQPVSPITFDRREVKGELWRSRLERVLLQEKSMTLTVLDPRNRISGAFFNRLTGRAVSFRSVLTEANNLN
jgi:hypothetical protein